MWHRLNNCRASEICLRVAPLLAINFPDFMIHGILPDSMLSILLVPVTKNKAGKVVCLGIYPDISLAGILSKVMGRVLLDGVSGYISFLEICLVLSHGTDVFIVNLYRAFLTCFIDASKAFD